MKNQIKIFLLFIAITIVWVSCVDDDKKLESTPVDDQEIIDKYLNIDLSNLFNYASVTFPVHYDNNVLSADNTPSNNPVTDIGATLGRVLFYDKNLSRNNTIACASCHKQSNGFVDEAQLSLGFEGGQTGAHSMRLANAKFYSGKSMFWNKRATSIEDQSTKPIQDQTEMGFDSDHGGFEAVVEKLNELPYYKVLFKRAFGDTLIDEERVQQALAQFVRSMVSVNSKFDEGFAGVYNPAQPNGDIIRPFANFTQQENQGKAIFLVPFPNGAGCAGCHVPPTFALDSASKSNGLTQGETTIFKAPSLKNVALTGPYMHDGSIKDLPGVVAHYNNAVQPGPALDNRLRNQGNILRLNLDQDQINALVAFLSTLTDQSIINDSKFSDPFKN
ncbi:MAG: cytochrome-c peroxidase [Bacteroidetes bacterium]|nr:cytochrome-c peroxidase [Bacteroidota bacterium]